MSIRLIEVGNPFQQGFRAAEMGSSRNPYPHGSYEHANWYFGYCIWMDGEDKNIFLHIGNSIQFASQKESAKFFNARSNNFSGN